MFLRKANSKWIVRTPAKLNVCLSIEGKRPDGYHELRTLMVPVRLFDLLTFEPLPGEDASDAGIRLRVVEAPAPSRDGFGSVSSPVVPDDQTNLVVRALSELRRRAGRACRAQVTLTKRIPVEAGLGGGSSDAAAALVAGNEAWGLGLPRGVLAEIATGLGSDVPFFLSCRASVCSGRGEIVTPLPRAARLHTIVVTPAERLASTDVYAALGEADFAGDRPDGPPLEQAVAAFLSGDVGRLARLLHNGLERAAVSLRPELARIRATMERWTGGSVLMTGSGSCFFSLCRTACHARRGAARLNSLGLATAVATASYG